MIQSIDMRTASFKHSLLTVDVDVCMYVRFFEDISEG